jgi:SAM-dependent methyltransferase
MSDATADGTEHRPAARETYLAGYGTDVHQRMTARTAADKASFLLPYLRPGVSLLDCGCGPGSITVDLADLVAPGEVVGIDIAAVQVERATALAAERGVGNVRFQVGSVYELPFPDAYFDVVFSCYMVEHLREPLNALREMRRVLRSGGIAAVRDGDYEVGLWEPSTPLLRDLQALFQRAREQSGSPYYARNQRWLLLEAEFARTSGFAFAQYEGDHDATRRFAAVGARYLRQPPSEATAALGVSADPADAAHREAMARELEAWGERPDAFWAQLDCAAIGWVDQRV